MTSRNTGAVFDTLMNVSPTMSCGLIASCEARRLGLWSRFPPRNSLRPRRNTMKWLAQLVAAAVLTTPLYRLGKELGCI
jgi:hypothetical protein